jgi:hypothetical protein
MEILQILTKKKVYKPAAVRPNFDVEKEMYFLVWKIIS